MNERRHDPKRFPSWRETPGDRPAFVGADLRPATVAAAFEDGFFPWPPMGADGLAWHERTWGASLGDGTIPALGGAPEFRLPWWSPDPRALLTPERVHVGRTMSRVVRRFGWTSTLDDRTEDVIRRCGTGRGTATWLTPELTETFVALAAGGPVHSVEVWAPDGLAAGLFGVLVGGMFTVESGFTIRPHGFKVATLDALARLRDGGGTALDLQMLSPHFASIGGHEVPREAFYDRFERSRHVRATMRGGRLPVARLAAPARFAQA